MVRLSDTARAEARSTDHTAQRVPQNARPATSLAKSPTAGPEATLPRPRDPQIGRAEGMILRVRWDMRLLGEAVWAPLTRVPSPSSVQIGFDDYDHHLRVRNPKVAAP